MVDGMEGLARASLADRRAQPAERRIDGRDAGRDIIKPGEVRRDLGELRVGQRQRPAADAGDGGHARFGQRMAQGQYADQAGSTGNQEVHGGILYDAAGMLAAAPRAIRSEEHTSELKSIMRTSYAVFCLKKTKP